MTDPADVIVRIRRNATGEVVNFNAGPGWDESSDYLWTDGNWGCDCNLSDFFKRAGGDVGDDSEECGSDRFDPIEAILPDGSRVEIMGETDERS